MKSHFVTLIAAIFCGMCHAQEVNKTSTSVFDELFGNSQQCYDACKQTFPLHTYDKPSDLEACHRGCRLFSICEWADDDADFNNTVKECSSACDEAYNAMQGIETSSCKVGCKSAVSPAQQRQTVLEEEEPHIHIFYSETYEDRFDGLFSQVFRNPFMSSSDSVMQGMFNYMSQLMQSDFMKSSMLSSIEDGNTGEVLIIRFNSPEINTQYPFGKQVKTDGNKVHSKTTLVDRIIESNLQTNLYERHLPYTGDYWLDSYDIDFDQKESQNFKSQVQEWWNCFVKKAGLPELALLLFWISTMILLVMCCAMQFPSKKSTTLSIRGDLAYIKETKGRIPEFLKVYGHPDVVRFTEMKEYKPDEKIPLSSSF